MEAFALKLRSGPVCGFLVVDSERDAGDAAASVSIWRAANEIRVWLPACSISESNAGNVQSGNGAEQLKMAKLIYWQRGFKRVMLTQSPRLSPCGERFLLLLALWEGLDSTQTFMVWFSPHPCRMS